MTTTAPVRRYDLDWLRVLVILTVFIFHCGRFFDTDGWHVKNPVRHESVQVWTVFLVCWMMPLIFVISGGSTYYAIRSRSAGKFLKDRAARLLVPLIVGIFTHIALQVYLERVSFAGFKGSFFEFYPQYFKGLYGNGGNFAWMGLHLWYLEMLFLFSLLFIPLFVFLLGSAGQKVIDFFSHWLNKPGALYLLAVPPMILFALLDPKTQWGQRGFGGWPPIIYAFWFIYGFLLPMREPIENRLERTRWLSVGAAGGIFLTLLVLWKSGGDPKFGTIRYAFLLSLYALGSWCFILGFLGLGRKFLCFTNAFVRYANEAVLPFYVLHQTVILTVGFFVVRWVIPDSVKFLAIAASSFALILAVYEFAIRRNNVLRFLFGMRMRPRPTPTKEASPGGEPVKGVTVELHHRS
jgi:peptidoglycan/LPS O-acetylase OafA/YrhL